MSSVNYRLEKPITTDQNAADGNIAANGNEVSYVVGDQVGARSAHRRSK